ncbi:MaoC/PaaZ C-terminal domain-containing protein [Cumulibacter soli]|uniref:MaoC/PaaZ C-terminal domain-containing protein n=1 Tax=Cumulibacter soli TaxID=2546344 RepID=UPI00141A596B|nr:MaoC/PaaZ C-terminal domain-containing protein [Cumulibacter soli]
MSDTWYADDLEPGSRISLGSYTVTESEIIDYAQRWDPIFIHADPITAADSPLGGVVASGLHTLAIYQRLAVRALWQHFNGGIGSGFEIRFRRAVRPDTTLTGHLTIQTVTARPERHDAKVTVRGELVDEDGSAVLELTNYSVLPLSPARLATSD